MGVITVSRTHGSGGTVFAKALAEHLGYRFVTRTLANKDNKALGRHFRTFGLGSENHPYSPERFRELMSNRNFYRISLIANIYDYALQNGVVFAGMGAGIILSEIPNILHLRIVRLLSERVKSIAQKKNIPYDDAFDLVVGMDDGKKEFISHYFDVDIADPAFYHLVLNGSYVTIEEGIEIVTGYAKNHLTREHPQETIDTLNKRLLEKRAEMLLFLLDMVFSYGKITFVATDHGRLSVRGIIGSEDEKERLFEHLKTNVAITGIDDHLDVGTPSHTIY